jgi:hypothetical protein
VRCGTLTTVEVCAACRLKERLAPKDAEGAADETAPGDDQATP